MFIYIFLVILCLLTLIFMLLLFFYYYLFLNGGVVVWLLIQKDLLRKSFSPARERYFKVKLKNIPARELNNKKKKVK